MASRLLWTGWEEGGTGGPAASPQGSTDSAPALSALLGPWGAECAPELGSLLPLLRPFPFTEGSSALHTLAPRVFRVRSSGKTHRGDTPTSWEPGDQAQVCPHCLLLASVLLGARLLRARGVGEGRKEMEGPERRAGVSGVLVRWPARGLPCRFFLCFWHPVCRCGPAQVRLFLGLEVGFCPQCQPEGSCILELSCWGVPPAVFSVVLSPVLAGDSSLGGTAVSLLWHPWAHSCQPTPPSLLCSFVLSWAPQSGAE